LTVFFYLIIHKNYCKHEPSKTETLSISVVDGHFPRIVIVLLVRAKLFASYTRSHFPSWKFIGRVTAGAWFPLRRVTAGARFSLRRVTEGARFSLRRATAGENSYKPEFKSNLLMVTGLQSALDALPAA